MNNSNRKVVMALVGAYLIYTGGSLIKDVLESQPENPTVFIIAGAVFVLVGLYTAIINVKGFLEEMKKEVVITDEASEEDEDTSEDDEEAEEEDEEEIEE